MSTPEMPIVQPLAYDATCRLCGKKFTGKPLNGPGDAERMKKMGEALFKHMLSTDEAHMNFAVITAVLAGFMVEDPAAQMFCNGVRFAALQSLRRHYLPDEQLHAVISALTPAEFEAAMADMRDFLTEQGAHAPKILQPSQNGKPV